MAGRAARPLILSDIHGNWPALEAVLAAEPQDREALEWLHREAWKDRPVELLYKVTLPPRRSRQASE